MDIFKDKTRCFEDITVKVYEGLLYYLNRAHPLYG